jgi:RHS repeat-associated protein
VTVTYAYDAFGRRVQRTSTTSGTEKFVYDGADVIRDLNGSGSIIADYLNGPGIDNKLRMTAGGVTSYFVADHLGTTQVLTDASGNASSSLSYDSYGNVSSGSASTRYTYTGREADVETGLMYYRARWYDSQQGRFMSEDPIGFKGGPNWYAYVGGNPLSYRDPLGLDGGASAAVLGGLAAGGEGAAIGAAGTLVGGAVVIGGLWYGAWQLGEWIAEQPWNPLTHPQDLPQPRAVPECDNPPKVIPIPAPPSQPCPPCRTISGRIVPVGTIVYRPLENRSGHGVPGPHHNLFVANQAPASSAQPQPCKCFWQKIHAVPPPPPPGAIPNRAICPVKGKKLNHEIS